MKGEGAVGGSSEGENEPASGSALSELEAALLRALDTVPREQVVKCVATSLPVELLVDESTPLHGGKVRKVSVSMPEELVEAVRSRVGAGGFSRYVSEVVEREVRHERLGRLLDELEAEYGPVPPEIQEQADRMWPNYEEDEDEGQ
jgi:Arc/MetJ-type ribon-helix-helix transcriptional regulator